MPELNKANRQVADLDIRILKTMAPFLFFDTANTTTVGLSGDSVYAMAKGARRIAFANPAEGTLTVSAQVYPFKLFSLLSDGTIENSAVYAATKEITCSVAGELAIESTETAMVEAGSVFVYPADAYGEESAMIEGTYADGKFTATTSDDLAVDSVYKVGYMINRTGVKKVSFNNKKLPRDYFITMTTVDKDEQDLLTPFVITAYKASIQRNFELSFASEGDPASVELTFDLMEDKEGRIMDMVELTDDAY